VTAVTGRGRCLRYMNYHVKPVSAEDR